MSRAALVNREQLRRATDESLDSGEKEIAKN